MHSTSVFTVIVMIVVLLVEFTRGTDYD